MHRRVYLEVPDILWRRVKIQANLEGRTVRALVNRVLKTYLQEKKTPEALPLQKDAEDGE